MGLGVVASGVAFHRSPVAGWRWLLYNLRCIGRGFDQHPGARLRAGLLGSIESLLLRMDAGSGRDWNRRSTSVGNQQKWDTFVKERSGGNGSVVGLPEQVVVAFAAG